MPEEEVVQDLPNEDLAPQNPDGVEMEEPQQIEDGNYINEPVVPATDNDLSVGEEQRTLKLYDLFEELHELIEIYYDSFKVIQFDMLEHNQYVELSSLIKKIFKLKEDSNYYLTDIFVNESYEKNLYTYVLIRTNFVEIIKRVREILKLHDVNEEEKRKESENKD